ncbi:uncharacterized protein LOC136033047 isoform X2 [Artemia franciscana]|uniref:uncharacterized protein LOC136033047 isoform X2 n=1 Tax=Artemia franciscana TaxID=6661 RepID=UPI0032DA3C41
MHEASIVPITPMGVTKYTPILSRFKRCIQSYEAGVLVKVRKRVNVTKMATANDLQALEKAVWKDLGIEKDSIKGVDYEEEVEEHQENRTTEILFEVSDTSIQAIAALIKQDKDEVWDSGIDSDKPCSPAQIPFPDLETVPILPSLIEYNYDDNPGTESLPVVEFDETCNEATNIQNCENVEEVRVTIDTVDKGIKPEDVKVIARKSVPRKGKNEHSKTSNRERTFTESTDEFPGATSGVDSQGNIVVRWGKHASPYSDLDEGLSDVGDCTNSRSRWEDQFDCNRPQKKRRYEEEPSTDPNVEKSRKNAIIAKKNRDRKKQRMEELLQRVAELEKENYELKRERKQLTSTINCQDDEIVYLKSVISNETSLGSVLEQMKLCLPARYSNSFKSSRRNGPESRSDIKPTGGICVHVDGNNLSLEMCRMCSKMSNGAPHTIIS